MPPLAIVTVSESVLPAAVTVMAAVPSKFTPLIARGVASAVAVDAKVAVDALPVSAAVIVPAVKLPDASRATIAEAVFADAAVVAVFDTFDAVEIVASFVSTIAALALMSALTITPAAMAVAKDPVPLPVTSPVRVIVWSPVFVPLRFDPVTAPVAAIVDEAVIVVAATVEGLLAPSDVFVMPTAE